MAEAKEKTKVAKLVTAYARHLHVAPRKMRLVTNLVKSMYATDALVQLQHANKKAAPIVAKLINSAIANAQHNFSLNAEDMFIKSITTDAAKVLKRYMPRARGSASTIHRRMSHINIVLEEKKRGKGKNSRFSMFKKMVKPDEEGKAEVAATELKGSAEEGKSAVKKSQVTKTSEQKKENRVQQKRRLFNRKAGV